MSRLRGRIALDGHQGRAQRRQQVQLMLEALWRIGKRFEHLQTFGEVTYGLEIGGVLKSAPAGALPVGNGSRRQPCCRVVLGQQFGLRLDGLGESCLQHLGNPLMILLPCTPQQRLISSVLDQGVLKEVRCLGRQTLLIQKLRLH
jgi:hypothetical protein